MITRNYERKDWELVLHRILEVNSKDFALIKVFLSVWWSGGKQRQLVVATGGHGWWGRSV